MAQPSRIGSASADEPAPAASEARSGPELQWSSAKASEVRAPAQDARVLELLRRIEELEALPESAFGRFTRWDWLACALLSLVLPAAALLWFGR